MIRIKNKHKHIQKPKKLNFLDSMKFMRKERSLFEEKESAELVDSQSSQEEIIIHKAEVTELPNFTQNTSVKSKIVYRLKDKQGLTVNSRNDKLPPFFREIQKVSKKQLQQAKLQSKQEKKVEEFLLSQNEPIRKNYH